MPSHCSQTLKLPRNFRYLALLGASLLFTVLTLTSCEDKLPEKSNAEAALPSPPEVKVRTLMSHPIYDPLWFGGYLQAAVDYQVIAEKSGVVVKKHVGPGDWVKKGQSLVDVRPSSLGLDHRTYIIKAPMSGIVSQLPVDLGTYLKPSQVVASLADTSAFYIDILGSYQDSLTLTPKAIVSVFLGVSTPKEQSFSGFILSVNPSSDPTTGLYPMRVSFRCRTQKNPIQCQNLAKIGSFVKVLFKNNKRTAIQIASKEFTQGRHQVLIYKDNGTAEERKVQTGRVIAGKFEIISGLEEGENLIVSYKRRPKSGEKVQVSEQNQKTMSKTKNLSKEQIN